MAQKFPLRAPLLVAALSLAIPVIAQTSQAQPQAAQLSGDAQEPAMTLKTFSRMVTLELVVTDAKGHHINNLKPEDIKIFEQNQTQAGAKHEQKIAEFREVRMSDLRNPVASQPQVAPGVYTNAVTVEKDPVPATILLVDGLNTDVQYQPQVHMQMMRMLRQLPSNVPVAVFLLGDRLRMLQNFTTDPRLLQTALADAMSAAGKGLADIDPRDDSQAASSVMTSAYGINDPSAGVNSSGGGSAGSSSNNAPGAGQNDAASDPILVSMIEMAQEFDLKIYSSTMDERIHRTFDALVSLGRNVAGYPGRKNLLWLSTTFPIDIIPRGDVPLVQMAGMQGESVGDMPGVIDPYSGYRSYREQLQYLDGVLSDANISVYPVNVAGVQTMDAFKAETNPPDVRATALSDSMNRNVQMLAGEQDTMLTIADGTGGKVCTGDNDLGDCIRKAVDDSSDFYEIAYYPDSADWNGQFRKITIKTGLHGAHLAYRSGYFAEPAGSTDSKVEAVQLQSDCNDYLDATAIPFMAKSTHAERSDDLKFSLLIDSSGLTLAPTADGRHQLNLALAVCTYNEKGWPLRLMNYPVNMKLSARQYNTLTATGKLLDTISVPGPRPAAVRLLIKDITSGKLGSIYIKTDELVAESPAASGIEAERTKQ
ncbi:MAG: VWA domain-containing protein [Terracidiphilus sp.]